MFRSDVTQALNEAVFIINVNYGDKTVEAEFPRDRYICHNKDELKILLTIVEGLKKSLEEQLIYYCERR